MSITFRHKTCLCESCLRWTRTSRIRVHGISFQICDNCRPVAHGHPLRAAS